MYIIKDTEIDFIWINHELINKVVEYSAIYTQNGGDDEFDKMVLSPGDIAFFEIMVNKHFAALSSLFVKCSNFKQDSLFVGELVDEKISAGFTVYRNIDHTGSPLYDVNRVMMLDKMSEEYIITSILLEWATVNELSKRIGVFEVSKSEAEKEIKNNLFHTRAPSYKKSYSSI